MVNRVFKWWNEVIAWKERWEKLFPASFLQSKDFQRAELKKMEKILAFPRGKLNEDEKLSRKYLRQEYIKLNRKIYPNPFIRFGVNAAKVASGMIRWTFNKLKKPSLPHVQSAAQNNKAILDNNSEIKAFLEKGIAEYVAHSKTKSNKNAEMQAQGNLSKERSQIKPVMLRKKPAVNKNGFRRKR